MAVATPTAPVDVAPCALPIEYGASVAKAGAPTPVRTQCEPLPIRVAATSTETNPVENKTTTIGSLCRIVRSRMRISRIRRQPSDGHIHTAHRPDQPNEWWRDGPLSHPL